MNQNKIGIFFFWLLEVNLILWVFVAGYFFPDKSNSNDFEFKLTMYLSIIGLLLAACLQHWAYYNVYKPIKEKKKQDAKNT